MIQFSLEVDWHVDKVIKSIETFLVHESQYISACVLTWNVPHHHRCSAKLLLIHTALAVDALLDFAEKAISACSSTRSRARIPVPCGELQRICLHMTKVCNTFGSLEGATFKRCVRCPKSF